MAAKRPTKRKSVPVAAGAGSVASVAAPARLTWRERLPELHPRRFFLETWQQIDEESARERAKLGPAGKHREWSVILAFAMGAAFLTVMDNEYFGGRDAYNDFVPWLTHFAWFRDLAAPHFLTGGDASTDGGSLYEAIQASRFYTLGGHAWWAIWRVIGYFLLPVLLIKVGFRALGLPTRLRDYGLETKGFSQHVWIYFTLFGIVLLAVIAVSYTHSFSHYYPFYKGAKRSWFDFFTWEVLYAAQFFSLEFFFRGFWLAACRRAMGSYAIFAMIVPYCMIHFGKPMPEAFGAIIAGIALGTLAMKTRSIWSGFLIHVSVAISMDVAALLQSAHLPRTFWPG